MLSTLRSHESGRGVAELWYGPSLLGVLHEEHDGVVLRLESHAGAPLAIDATELERVLAQTRERFAAHRAAPEQRS